MGGTFGKGSTPVPVHDVLGKLGTGLEIRAYSPYVVAEVQDAGDGSEDDRFRTLAKFIGVFGQPANKIAGGDAGESIAMTAPVVTGSPSLNTGSKISMTAPVVVTPGSDSTMQFIMPKQFKKISDLPVPTDDRVRLREVPEHVYVVHQFSGNMGKGDGHDAVAERERTVAVERVAAADGGAFAEFVAADSKYLVARYDPPWTLPFLRTNELWFPLPLSREEVRHIDFKFLLKADDDTFVCVERLAKFLHNQPEESKDKLYAGVPTFCKAETNAARNEYAGIKFARLEAGGAFSYGLTRDTKELIKWGPGEGAPAVLVENIP
eukprot:g11343.t2